MAPVLISRATQADLGREGPTLLDVWIFFNLVVNDVLLPLLVATFLFSKRAKRHPTLVNLCITWIFSGEFSVLLFYAKQHVGPEPTKGLCVAQASLLYGITPMWSVSVFMLFWYMTIAICGDRAKSVICTYKLIFMLASPYIVQFSFSLAALIISVGHPDKVARALRYFYCALDFPSLSLAMSTFTLIMCIGIIALEVHLGMQLYRNWRCLRNAGKCNGVDFQFFLRVLTFGGYVAFGMVMNLVSMFVPSSVVPDMYAATAGTAVFLVFGTQADVIRVWCFWLPPVEEPQEPDPACALERNSFWRRSEPNFGKDVADRFADLPPPPPPKSKEYLMSIGTEITQNAETKKPCAFA
ncbi:hypothetical protein BDZ97DRAFT_905831 [Flammula alnicola]|nr:hypothetical protein BDZ97DRAFT_905831 [Flammula alnicola]